MDQDQFAKTFELEDGNQAQLQFQVWDDDQTTIIDALELFAGLVVFSKCTFQEKIRCKLGSSTSSLRSL